MLGPVLAGLGWGGSQALLARDLARKTPGSRPANQAYEQLGAEALKQIDERVPGRSPLMELNEVAPTTLREALDNPGKFAGNQKLGNGGYRININPNADRSYFAHELGHIVSDQTDVGSLIRSARSNPKIKKALLGSLLLLPGASAALTPGDDDYATSTALALAANSPVLLDELLASKNALGLMKSAGMPATLGQRGRLAGAFMTYLGPAVLAGLSGNAVGNLLDEDI